MKLPEKIFKELEVQLKKLKKDYSIPGMAFSIVEGDKIVYSNGLGFRNKEKQLPCNPETVFPIGSSSKSFTALSIMQLVEEGKLELSDPIDKYLHIKWARKFGEDNPITIQHLIAQTSGLSDMGIAQIERATNKPDIEPDPDLDEFDISSDERFLNHINGAIDFINPIGTWGYCNSNFILAHMIVEKITNQPYEEFVREHLFEPCEMTRSTLRGAVYNSFENKTISYFVRKEGDIWKTNPIDWTNPRIIMGAGGYYTSVRDLGKFTMGLMNNGIYNGKSFLKPISIKELTTNKTISCHLLDSIGIKGIGSKNGNAGYSYGFFVIEDFLGKYKVVLMLGSVVVSSSTVILFPDLNIGFNILWNAGEAIFGDLIFKIMGMVMMLLGKNPKDEFKIMKEDMRLNKLCGRYFDYIKKNPLNITREEDDLFIQWDGREKKPLHPFDKEGDCMRYYWKSSPTGFQLLTFSFEDNNKIRLRTEKHTLLKEINVS